jgi:protein TonB
MKRPDISGLKSNYFMRFQIGAIFALSFALAAFNFTTYPLPDLETKIELIIVDEDIPVIRTAADKPKKIPPPPVVKNLEKIEIVETTDIVEEKPEEIPEKIEVSEDTKAIFVAPKPKMQKRIKKPVVVAPPEPELDVDEIKIYVDEMPRFDICAEADDDKSAIYQCATEKLLAYVSSKIKYPAIARENGLEGKVVVQFVVEKDGSISNANIVRDIGGGCGAEALRVVNDMPNWVPGRQRSKPVRVKFTLPVKFGLSR